jgi:glutamate/tyrosine decarboxylase-like PLP-dependent enzyme
VYVNSGVFILLYLQNSVDGLTYAGVGWAVWRNKSFLPDEILFTVNYLGSPQVSFTLNFSKSGVHVIGQYYQFLRLGKAGYRNIVRFFRRDLCGLGILIVMCR